ncbi:unnamed protein product [Peniophora sp. CBMAI 1063]|nr:unnamed protein product [Peniophora sp. CBMAI 1063]
METATTHASSKQVVLSPTSKEYAPKMPQDLRQKRSAYGWKIVADVKTFSSRHPVAQVVDLHDVRSFYESKAREVGISRGVSILLLDYDKATKSLTFVIWLARNFITFYDKLLSPDRQVRIPSQQDISKFCGLAGLEEPGWFPL